MKLIVQTLLFCIATAVCARAAESRPNIIFILTDDQRYDAMGFMKHYPWLETPNIDRIRNEGVHFKNAFTTHSLCAPSRAGFLTGMHSHKNGIATNQHGRELNPDKTPSFGQHLQKEGYRTGFIGKWHMGHDDSPRAGWDYWCSFYGQGNYDRNRININGKHVNKVGYVTDVLTDYAVEFIERSQDEPFLLYLSHKAVHGPFTPPERHENLYAGETLPRPASWDDDLDDKPEWQRRMRQPKAENTRVRRKNPLPVPATRKPGPFQSQNEQLFRYLRSIPAVDEGIGRIFETLEKLGQLDNTIIAFAGDNGYFHNEHGMGDKRQAYNEAMRIPFIMRGPGIKAGGTVEEIVLNIDLAPTVLELAGLNTPNAMQGRSLLPLASGKTVDDWRTSFLYTYWRDLVVTIPRFTTVRTIDKTYAHYPDGDSIDELYDLARDPAEMQNLAQLPEHAPLLKTMQKELKKVMDEAGYQAVVPHPNPEYTGNLPTGLLLDESFGSDGLACFGEAAKTLPMSQTLDPGFGTIVYECTVTPESDGVIASHGSRTTGYLFFVQNGVPGFCFTTANNPFLVVDGDVSCIGEPTHLLVELDSYNEQMRFFVNGELVQTETIYCKPWRWSNKHGGIVLGADPKPWVDPLEFSKMGGFTGTIHSYKIHRERMIDLEAYARKAAEKR